MAASMDGPKAASMVALWVVSMVVVLGLRMVALKAAKTAGKMDEWKVVHLAEQKV